MGAALHMGGGELGQFDMRGISDMPLYFQTPVDNEIIIVSSNNITPSCVTAMTSRRLPSKIFAWDKMHFISILFCIARGAINRDILAVRRSLATGSVKKKKKKKK